MPNIVRAVVSGSAFGEPSAASMRWLDMDDAVSANDRRNCRRYRSDVILRRHVNRLSQQNWWRLMLNLLGDARSQPVEQR
jgi:hypothetical protein